MKQIAATCCALILTSGALAESKDSSSQFDATGVEAANTITAAFAEHLGGGAETPLPPSTVRLPTADSRKAAQLLGADLTNSRNYLAQLAGKGVRRVSIRFAYPMFFAPAKRNDEFRYYYGKLRRFLDFHDMELVAVLGTQAYDAEYLRGFPAGPECTSDMAANIGELAQRVSDVINPDYLVVDLRPSSLARTRGCENAADPVVAGPATLSAVAEIAKQLPLATVGVMLDASRDADYARFVIAGDGPHFVAASTLSAPLAPAAALADVDKLRALTHEAGREFAIGELWLHKVARGNGGLDDKLAAALLADTASVWATADRWLGHYAARAEGSGEVLFATVHETDLLIGAYLDADEYVGPDADNPFNTAAEFPIGARTRLRNRSKAMREQMLRDSQRRPEPATTLGGG